MAAFIFAVLSLLLTVPANGNSNLEYTEDYPDEFPEYRRLMHSCAPPLKGNLVNSEAPVRFVRKHLSDRTGLYFRVEDETVPEDLSKTITKTSKHKSNKSETRLCNGMGGIKATLRNFKPPLWRRFLWGKQTEVFCVSDMHIEIIRVRNKAPYMRLTMIFIAPTTNHNIAVVFHPFKAFKNPYTRNGGPRIPSPIPLEEFSNPYLTPNTIELNKDGSQSFIGDISWMTEDVMYRTKLQRSGNCGPSGTYTEYYLAGPVAIERQAYNKILRLETSYAKYASLEEN